MYYKVRNAHYVQIIFSSKHSLCLIPSNIIVGTATLNNERLNIQLILLAFARLLKTTITFVMSVRLSTCVHGRIRSHWTDFHEIYYCSIFRSLGNIKFSLKSNKNNGYFTRIPLQIFDCILLSSSKNENIFRQKLYIKSKHTFYVQ